MRDTTRYTLSEGTFHLPCAAQDQSITVLTLSDIQATLVVAREWRVPEARAGEYLSQQLEKVKRDMKKFSAQAPADVQLGGFPAREVSMRFENSGVKIGQKLLVAWLHDHLVAITFSATGELSAAQLAAWQQIRETFVPGTGAA